MLGRKSRKSSHKASKKSSNGDFEVPTAPPAPKNKRKYGTGRPYAVILDQIEQQSHRNDELPEPGFSFRRLLCSSPFLPRRIRERLNAARSLASPETATFEIPPATFQSHSRAMANQSQEDREPWEYECCMCYNIGTDATFPKLSSCPHRSCEDCLSQYLQLEISESRVNITCPECPVTLHPDDIKSILKDDLLYDKYEDFMIRRVLVADADARWCPAPDCGYAVIATGCASCPKLKCEKPGCGSYFCYHCKAIWHPNQTCDAARAQRNNNVHTSISFNSDSKGRETVKHCPICGVLIVKMDDGSCNHMTCAVCGAEFCWLCMNVVGDLHYLSPSGCTFWGKKPWSKKKKICWQIGILLGAPFAIALIAGIAVPSIMIGIPIWIGRRMYTRLNFKSNLRRNTAIAGGVFVAMVASPVLAALAVAIGVPILMFYVYGVVPLSLCKSTGCVIAASSASHPNATGATKNQADDRVAVKDAQEDVRIKLTSKELDPSIGNPSIGNASIALKRSGSHSLGESLSLESSEDRHTDNGSNTDGEKQSVSNFALAGSIVGRTLEMAGMKEMNERSGALYGDSASTRSDCATSSMKPLHGSIFSYRTDALSTNSSGLNEGTADSVSQRSEANVSLSSLEELTASLVNRVRSTNEGQNVSTSADSTSEVAVSKQAKSKETQTNKSGNSRSLLRSFLNNLSPSSLRSQNSKTATTSLRKSGSTSSDNIHAETSA